MSKPVKTGDSTERALAGRFAQLRVSERAETPDFPSMESLSRVSTTPRRHGPIVAAALAAGIAAFALLFAGPKPAQDPGEIYASIMAASEITTDQLMLVSPGLLPEVSGLPAIYEIELPAFPQEWDEGAVRSPL